MAVRSQAATSVAPDDYEAPALTASRLLLRPGESERVASLRWDDSNSSNPRAWAVRAEALAFRRKHNSVPVALRESLEPAQHLPYDCYWTRPTAVIEPAAPDP
jgi:hypothetical protein